VMRDFTRHGPFWHFVGKDHGSGYSPVDGWRCVLFQGFSGCTRGGAEIDAAPLCVVANQTNCYRRPKR
jgi:hypothetical protein